MGGCQALLPTALLVGGNFGAVGAVDCRAGTEAACLARGGCRWFSYSVDEPCEFCEEVFGNQVSMVGCRDWAANDFCLHQVFQPARSRWSGEPYDAAFREAVAHYHITQGSGEPGNPHNKRWRCIVWCDASSRDACTVQTQAVEELRGVNYGGRFVPEQYLGLPGTSDLFADVEYPAEVLGKPLGSPSLCDVGQAADASDRMTNFLDLNVRSDHFRRMAYLGFNVVRLPLGYWNLIDLPGATTPNGINASRWRSLQRIMPAVGYFKWINDVFLYARMAGLKILLDLHGAPGAQAGNAFTGCDEGNGNVHFDTDWNKLLAVRAVKKMARVCSLHGDTCYGIELLNEPYGAHTDLQYSLDLFRDLKTCAERAKLGMPCTGVQQMFTQEQLEDVPGLLDAFNASRAAGAPAPAVRSTYRLALKGFYERAIRAARAHLAPDTPIVIMEWPRWLRWWTEHAAYPYAEFGHIAFAAHLYKFPEPPSTKQQEARDFFQRDLAILRHFFLHSKYELMVSEYALNSHGPGGPDDHFDYNAFTDWSVSQFNQFGIGSMVWNFDSYWVAWGPVKNNHVGRSVVDWKTINGYQW
mmetsp:Transcript_45655/g.141117  ORF Transcript_45655/g.141117 Transcript_45655/m.141117 type:complete len:582 (-) Transcript_45655:51-1796(-)